MMVVSPNKFHISFVETPEYYNIRILDTITKQRVNDYYNTELVKLKPEVQNYFNRILIYMNEKNINMDNEFKFFTNKLDKIRNQDTRLIFPELTSYFDHVKL
jgi:hypothetical protein